MTTNAHKIFKQGSTTYYHSSLFFPRSQRADVFTLYAFVRTADNFVDCIPQDTIGFTTFVTAYRHALTGTPSHNPIIDNFIELQYRLNFEQSWVDAFLDAMHEDTQHTTYETLDDTLRYVYGSAEVIGLMMARIIQTPPTDDHAARMLGRSMQYINFIRDIAEDLELGRIYFPTQELNNHDLSSLTHQHTSQYPDQFTSFMRAQIERYENWRTQAREGIMRMPRRLRAPIATASNMYHWTGMVIARNPFIVYTHKVKPSRARIVTTLIRNLL